MGREDVKGLAEAAKARMIRLRPAAQPTVSADRSPFGQPAGPALAADPAATDDLPAEAPVAVLAAEPRARPADQLRAAVAAAMARLRPADDRPEGRPRRHQVLLRTTALVALVAAVVYSAGQVMQTRATAHSAAPAAPRAIVALSAGVAPELPATARLLPMPEVNDPEAAAQVTVSHPPEAAITLAAAGDGAVDIAPILPLPGAPLPKPPASTLPRPAGPAPGIISQPAPPPVMLATTPTCTADLDVTAVGRGLLLVRFEAPCAAGSPAVLRHGPLALSVRLDEDGRLDLALPALTAEGEILLRLPEGEDHQAAAPTDLAGLRRVALQWQGSDALELHAFEGAAADYGTPGHVWTEAPGLSETTGLPAQGGWLVRLGDDGVPLPQLADIYTFPADPAQDVRLSVEAPVTEATCGREVLAEAVLTVAGETRVDEITLAIPGCDSLGGYVVLNYPAEGTKLAAGPEQGG